LSRWQWVNLFSPNGYERLMRALHVRATSLGLGTSPTQPTAAPVPQYSSATAQPERKANVQVWGGMEFVRVPAGKFLMGSKDDNKWAWDDEKPQHAVEIPYDYWMARYPVTNDQFARFIEETAYKFSLAENWNKKADHPVVNVDWQDAIAYCRWLNEVLRDEVKDLQVRLPTEAEWEKAARGDAQRGNEWPWGNRFDPRKCNSSEGRIGGTTPVGAYSPQGDSPYGVADMAGNVWEWCHSLYQPYPYRADDGREDESATGVRVWRGGSWGYEAFYARCTFRLREPLAYRGDILGFLRPPVHIA
jgi:formylglycine-generating enzyme required for sulfatase activity